MHPIERKASSSSPTHTTQSSHEEEESDPQGLFPQRLRSLLNDDTSGVVEWFEDGSGFRICNKIDFVNLLLQKYFRCTKYRSFTRQLNVYGFKRVPDPKKKVKYGFRHAYFRRDFPDLMHFMSRRKPAFSRSKKEEITASLPSLPVLMEHANSSSSMMSVQKDGDIDVVGGIRKASSSNFDSEEMSSYSASMATTLDDEDIALTDLVMLQEMLKDSPKEIKSFDLLSPSSYSSYRGHEKYNSNYSHHPDKPN